MKNIQHIQWVIVLLLGIMLLNIVSAEYLDGIQPKIRLKQSTEQNITISCEDVNGTLCEDTTTCAITMNTINGINIFKNQSMTYSDEYFYYQATEEQTATNGDYLVIAVCNGNNEKVTRFYLRITPNGEEPNVTKGFLQLGALFVLVIFFLIALKGVFSVEHYVGRFAIFWVAYLLLISISFIAWNMSLNILTESTFVIGMFKIIFYVISIAMFPLVLLSMAWIFYIHTMNDEIKRLMERGFDSDEAYARARGKKKWH